MNNLDHLLWPVERLHEALDVLARRANLAVAGEHAGAAVPPGGEGSPEALGAWLDRAAGRLGLECEAVDASASELDALLASGGPALIRHTCDEQDGVLLLIDGTRRTVQLLAPDLATKRLSIHEVRAALCAAAERPVIVETDMLLEETRVAHEHRPQVRDILVAERLAAQRIATGWILRAPPGASLWQQ